MEKFVMRFAAAWVIVIGGLLLVPGHEPKCIVCGDKLNVIIGVVSVVLGAAALIGGFRTKALA